MALAIRDVVEVQQPAFARLVLNIARIMKRHQPDTAGFKSREPERVEDVVIERGLAVDVVVRDQQLPADEPVPFECDRDTGPARRGCCLPI